ncbi:hypothetical protein FB560_0905 [Microbacterium saperdae]|uniref:Uncharacterized protein n=1 Tax=Microbacterium saperdae TaxID=69368 RepID=A0A543BKF4_9MICO|nr:hypothetical protein FB560_0905 [Microbacterium saperdae]
MQEIARNEGGMRRIRPSFREISFASSERIACIVRQQAGTGAAAGGAAPRGAAPRPPQ